MEIFFGECLKMLKATLSQRNTPVILFLRILLKWTNYSSEFLYCSKEANGLEQILTKFISQSNNLELIYFINSEADTIEEFDKAAKVVVDGLKSNTSLIEVSFENKLISDEGAIALAEGLKSNKTLQEINLQKNLISDKAHKLSHKH